MKNCATACLWNAIAGVDDERVLQAFCGNAGAGVPGLIYPVPFEKVIPVASRAEVKIDPLNDPGGLPFAMLLPDTTDANLSITEIKNPTGDAAGLKGGGTAANSSISSAWPVSSFFDAERIRAGLPNLPPAMGLASSSKPFRMTVANADTSNPHTISGIIFLAIPKRPLG